ncbi:DUF4097 family beta strand repeat-containing protein [Alicyclobacillus fastidiosus]|uniref:DUF4097 family beta strand repeat-containing protein n=1 Tax=Alicyclobacillus fastidiosus TaxID=392011 RepID=A0ABV5AB36_9BACL|nr:DUF4097 family beta strand repeat-containing protein [Alicyclobacillus fastidiosus]WEH10546.1 DUF4097 family beta strand repeat-containing protein [Alicyclobacillus fastidiosus]
MRRNLVILASSLIVIGLIGTGIGAATGDLWKTPVSLGSIRGQVSLTKGIKNIDLVVPTANVTVVGTSGNTLTYSGELTVLHQKTQEEADQLVRSEWKIQKSGDTLTLTLEQPRSQWAGLNVSWRSPQLELTVPSAMATQIKTSNGAVNIQTMNASVRVQTSNARITASSIHGSVALQTSNGKITVKNMMGSVTAVDSNAGIEAASIHGSVDLRSSNGSITLNSITGSATAIDSNSAIDATSSINNKWYLETTNGHIALSVPTNTNATISASTSNASIRGNVHWNSNDSGQGSCILGTGLHQVHLETSNGSITVNYSH